MALNINGTTGISGVDGSVSAPALTGTDSNTGITFPSADTIKIATGGIERLLIDNSAVVAKGHVLQVVRGSNTTQVDSTAGAYVDTGLTKSITPLQTGSNMYVLVHQHIFVSRSNNAAYGVVKIMQDSTDRFVNANTYLVGMQAVGASTVGLRFPLVISSFHAHGVTAGTSTTYKTQMMNHQTSDSGSISAQQGNSTSTITIMEIGV